MPIELWNQRFGVLNDMLTKMVEQYDLRDYETDDCKTEGILSRLVTLANVTRCLQTFAQGQFDFFYFGLKDEALADDKLKHTLNESDFYPPNYAITSVLNQIAHDAEVIQRAAHQRLSGTDAIKQKLSRTDRLAWDALQPAQAFLQQTAITKGKTPTVVTYFQKTNSTVVIPYAPVGLIGIPYTALRVSQDLLAIPHEVGHYLYRHGRVPGSEKRVSEVLRADVLTNLKGVITKDNPHFPDWCFRWLEEIFADVYGCLVAGPVIALDFQDLMFQKAFAEFTDGDDSHPLPLLRPVIYNKILAHHPNQNAHWIRAARRLQTNWVKRRADDFRQGSKTRVRLGHLDLRIEDLISDGVEPLTTDKPIDAVLGAILSLLSTHCDFSHSDWTGNLDEFSKDQPGEEAGTEAFSEISPEETIRVYRNADEHLARVVLPVPEFVAGNTADLWHSWVVGEKFFTDIGDVGSLRAKLASPETKLDGGAPWNRKDGWIPVLIADGWATEGPNGSWKPPGGI